MKYGIRDGQLHAPLESLFSVASDAGFDGVEFCIDRDYATSLLWQSDGPERLLAAAAGGAAISSLSPGVFAPLHPACDDDAQRREGIALLTHVIEVCPRVKTREILVPLFPRNVPEWPESVWQRLIDGFKELAAAAEAHGITLNLESTFDAAQLIHIIGEVGSDAIRVYYDTSNHTEFGHDVPAEMRKLGKLINMIHAKDYHNKMLGEGSVDFTGVDAAIREIGFDGWIVLETPTGDDPTAANARNLEFIRKLGR